LATATWAKSSGAAMDFSMGWEGFSANSIRGVSGGLKMS
jgi:hypothetical protein